MCVRYSSSVSCVLYECDWLLTLLLLSVVFFTVKRAKFAGPSGESYHVLSFCAVGLMSSSISSTGSFLAFLHAAITHDTPDHTHTHTKRNRKTFNALRPRWCGIDPFWFPRGNFFFFFDILNFRLGVQMYAGPLWLGEESFLCFPFFFYDCYDILHFQLFHADNGCASGVISIFPPRCVWCAPKERGGERTE
jgi:hypothetical protein